MSNPILELLDWLEASGPGAHTICRKCARRSDRHEEGCPVPKIRALIETDDLEIRDFFPDVGVVHIPVRIFEEEK